MKTVKDIRNGFKITEEPIVYYWFFKKDCTDILLAKLKSEIDFNKINRIDHNNEDYLMLYVGKGKNGNDRLKKYHILDSNNFHDNGVENGRLSSLRTTLCGLLDLPMSTSKKAINEFIDENCIVYWKTCSLKNLDKTEETEITSNYLPLNYQHTKGILTKEHRKILSSRKKRMRK